MANNCLVTKLKGVVDNDNIPVFEQTTFFLAQSGGSDNTDWAFFRGNGRGEVLLTPGPNCTLQKTDGHNPMHGYEGWWGWVRKSGTELVELTIKSCYNILDLRLVGVRDIKGVHSLFYGLNGFIISSINSKLIKEILIELTKHSNFQKIWLGSTYDAIHQYEDLAKDVFMANRESLLQWNVDYCGSTSWFTDTNLQYYRGGGNLEDLPTTLREFDSVDYNGYRINGNLNTFFTKCIESGRTSGTIHFQGWPSSFQGMTITNDGVTTSLASYMSSIGLNIHSGLYISWNAQGQITLTQNSVPSDYVAPVDPYPTD